MDDFVRNKLIEWGLSNLIGAFEDEEIDEVSFRELDGEDFEKLIPKLGPRKKFVKLFKKEFNTTNQEIVDSSAQVCPSTSGTSDKVVVKRSSSKELEEVFQGEPSKRQSPSRKQRHEDPPPGSDLEKRICLCVKERMNLVNTKIANQNNKISRFLRKEIADLETDKRELVGVFGKTGAGKSSLINAIIGVDDLLPSGTVSACTSVMIKVEANMRDHNYEAEIEFITQEEWKDELWSFAVLRNNADQEEDQEDVPKSEQESDPDSDPDSDQEDDDDADTVLSALYGKEWGQKSREKLMEHKFREIPEFHNSKKKILTKKSAKELSAELVKYTRSDCEDGEAYWPLVKCVTIKVPDNDFLQHVTLVDLPGNGDHNRSRNKMWKGIVGSCSAVWIVADINRAADANEPWMILENASRLMGNGGECQHIHFICTKSDLSKNRLADNAKAKKIVHTKLDKSKKFEKQFDEDCFEVVTVSSTEILEKKPVDPSVNEMHKLQTFLRDLNDSHSETVNYVSGAVGILSLIQGARDKDGAQKRTEVAAVLEDKMRDSLDNIRRPMEEAEKAFEKHLSEGVEKSKSSREKVVKSLLRLQRRKGGAFHKTLKSVVKNSGKFKPRNKKEIDFNVKLASCLTDSIDKIFRKTFPNERKCGPYNGCIAEFSLGTKGLIKKYKEVELPLTFLMTEEEKIKTKLNKIIRDRKKTIYNSLTTSIEEDMKTCYEEAAAITGQHSLAKMRDIIEKHVESSKDIMFEKAKGVMMRQLRDLKDYVLKKVEETMQESIELSLRTDCVSLPDVTTDLCVVKKYYEQLASANPPGPAAALNP